MELTQHARPKILTVPGLDGSGPYHWQSIWERERTDTYRVELGQWSLPHRNSWISRLEHAICSAGGPIILAAHSLGCIAVAWWAQYARQPDSWPVVGALMVAPADVEQPGASERVTMFSPIPRERLPFRTLVVASDNDPWISLERAHGLAINWGGDFIGLQGQGHLNADSDLGSWTAGQELLACLIDDRPAPTWPPVGSGVTTFGTFTPDETFSSGDRTGSERRHV